jgi:hypothetical protein
MTPPPPVTLASTRASIAAAIQGAGYKAHAYAPPTVIPPAVIIVPDQPYLRLETIGNPGTRVVARYELIVCVAALDNQAQLDGLEKIAIDVLQVLPQGTVVGDLERPTIEQVGPSSLLTLRIPIEVRATLTSTPAPPPEE